MRTTTCGDEDADAFGCFDHDPRFVEIVTESLHECEQQRVVGDRRVATPEMVEDLREQLGCGSRIDGARRVRFARRIGAGTTRPDVRPATRTLFVAVHRNHRPDVATPRTTHRARRRLAQDIVTTSSSSISACSKFWIAISVPLVELGQLPHAPW